MTMIERELRYANTHEWVRVEDDIAVIGISDYAQSELGELVYVELPEIGSEVMAGDETAVVESVKAASDVYAPVSGRIVEVNEALENTPDMVNNDVYGDGWLYKIRMSDEDELTDLLSAEQYQDRIDE